MENNLLVFETFHDERFKTIKLSCVEDHSLSWKAKGIHTYIISRPPGWKINSNDLKSRSIDGTSSLRSGIKELIEAKYLYKMIKRNPKTKQIVQWGYLCFESKIELEEVEKKLAERKPEWSLCVSHEDHEEDPLSSANTLDEDFPVVANPTPLINIIVNNNQSSVITSGSKEPSVNNSSAATAGVKMEPEGVQVGVSEHPKLRFKPRTPKPTITEQASNGIKQLFNEMSEQNKKPPKKAIANAPESALEIIECWKCSGFKAPDPNKAPVAYNKTIKYIRKLQTGRLFTGDQRKFNLADIKEAIEKFRIRVFEADYGNTQAEKDMLAKICLHDFFYSPFSRGTRSWFLRALEEPIPKRTDVKIVENKHPEITNRIRKFYYDYVLAGFKKRLSESEENKFREAANKIAELNEKKGHRFVGITNGNYELADLLCAALSSYYKDNVSRIVPGSFCSSFAMSRLIAYMNTNGYIVDDQSNSYHNFY
jgi:hypothetical protein